MQNRILPLERWRDATSIGLGSTGKWRVRNRSDQRARVSILECVAGSFLCRGELKSSYSGGLTLARSQGTTQPLTHPTLFIGMRDKIGRTKASKLIGQGNDSEIAERKKKLSNNWKAITHQLPQADWWPSNGHLGRESPHLLHSTPAFIAEHVAIWFRISLWSIQVGCPAVSLPNNQPIPQWSRKTEAMTLCKHWLAIAKTLVGYQHCFRHKF